MTCTATRHGTASAYQNSGCRCPEALVQRRRQNKLRALYGQYRYTDPTGTRRRLQALMAIGWNLGRVAAGLGYTDHGCLSRLLYGSGRVEVATATKVRHLYEQWSGTPGPSRIARQAARKAGYAPPLAWDGHTIDDPSARPTGTAWTVAASEPEVADG